MAVTIATFRPEHSTRFAELNRQWLDKYALMEPAEEAQLADPRRYFIDTGGQIFVACADGEVVGTCAVLPYASGVYELAKLAVAPQHQGQGVARRLVSRCITYAREEGAERLILVTNSKLRAAISLYEAIGFEHRKVPEGTKYTVADVCMVLALARLPHGGTPASDSSGA